MKAANNTVHVRDDYVIQVGENTRPLPISRCVNNFAIQAMRRAYYCTVLPSKQWPGVKTDPTFIGVQNWCNVELDSN
jgi:hypothetical protein